MSWLLRACCPCFWVYSLITAVGLIFHSWAQKVYFPNLSKSDCMSDVARICSIITFHLSELWKVKFSILWCHISCDAAGEFWHWSLSGVKGLTLSLTRAIKFKFLLQPHQYSYALAKRMQHVACVWPPCCTMLRSFGQLLQPDPKCCIRLATALYDTVWRTWFFIAYSNWKMIIVPSKPHNLTYIFLFKRLGECSFWAWEWKG